MIDLGDVRSRIEGLSDFKHVGTIVTAVDAMGNESVNPPQAFVSTSSERAAPNRLSTGRHRQLVTQTVSVLWVQAAERADDDPNDVVDRVRRRIVDHLIGWRPQGADSPFDYVSFSVPLIGGGLVWAEALFSAPYILSKAV